MEKRERESERERERASRTKGKKVCAAIKTVVSYVTTSSRLKRVWCMAWLGIEHAHPPSNCVHV